MSADQATKHRTSFTDIERQGLRAYHQKYPATSRPALASWFELQFGRKISVSSVHDILSGKYAHLDNVEATGATRKQRGPQWQELEDALFKWWQGEQPRRVTGRELKDKANELWHLSPACRGKKVPSFSDGWLTNWRNRHGLAQPNEPSNTPYITPYINSGCESIRVRMAVDFVSLDLPPPILPAVPQSCVDKHRSKRQCTKRAEGQPTILDIDSVVDGPILQLLVPKAAAMSPFYSHNTSSPLSPAFWKNIWELSSNCSAHSTRNTVMPSRTVLNVFDPILKAAEVNFNTIEPKSPFDYHFERYPRLTQRGVRSLEFRKAINLLNTAELFVLPRSTPEKHTIIYDEWFLDCIRPEILRSPSPGAPEDDKGGCATLVRDRTATLRLPKRQVSQSHTFMSSTVGKGGRVDIWTRTYNNKLSPNEIGVVEQFYADITITPPPDTCSIPQTVFRLSRETSQFQSTLLTPIISFRRTRPDNDDIFRIAERGTSEALQRALSSGEASLTDCDTKGRSLINYALWGLNTSTLKYLLTKLDDLDVYEADCDGDLCPLIEILPFHNRNLNPVRRRQMLACMNLMLDCGTDLSLPRYAGRVANSIFEVGILFAPVDTVKLMLDKGEPFVTANKSLEWGGQENALLWVAFRTLVGPPPTSPLSEKVFLLLERGADVRARDRWGSNCLHMIFKAHSVSNFHFSYTTPKVKDALICLVTAGADVDACDKWGRSVSEFACEASLEELWIEVLAECGYDPEPFLQCLGHYYRRENAGLGVFSTVVPKVRSTRLSFAEHGKQRKSLPCSSKEITDWKAYFKSRDEWIELLIDEEFEDEDDGDGEVDIYSTQHGAEWWL